MAESVPVFSRAGDLIQDLAGWESSASTAGKWADGFSAKELARLWLSGQGSAAVCAALRPTFPDLRFSRAIAEAQVRFDDYPGGVRNHDVLAFGSAKAGEIVVGIEGKVNEPLDATLAGKYAQANARKREGKNTNLDSRVDDLLDAIVGRPYSPGSPVARLRYQLFSAIAGTAAAATSSTVAAAVVVYLINSSLASGIKFAETRKAVGDFCTVLDLDPTANPAGPIVMKTSRGASPAGLPIWLAVVETGTAHTSE